MRIDKLLANLAFGSRKEVHELLKKGEVTVNDVVINKKDFSVNPEVDTVTVRGEIVDMRLTRYIKFYKPAGYITAVEDRSAPTVMELLPEEFVKMGIVPVGRLDKDTEGLLILTNDGKWAHTVINGKKKVCKTYAFTYEGTFVEDAVAKTTAGLVLADGTECKPGHLQILNEREGLLTISEGKFHQVKRMVAALGANVTFLERLTVGTVTLEGLEEPGDYMDLTQEELDHIFDPVTVEE